MDKNVSLKVYSREPEEGKYPNGLAYSVHLALKKEGEYTPLHNNYGILFPKAEIDERNVIIPKFVRNLRIARFTDTFGICNSECKATPCQRDSRSAVPCFIVTGEDVCADGTLQNSDKPQYWCWCTEDLVSYSELGLLDAQSLERITGETIETLRKTDKIEISATLGEKLLTVWNPLTFQSLEGETVVYSDGSKHRKNLKDYPDLKFPLARGFGDPVILLWEDEYYFIATNDNLNDIGLYVRKAHNLDDLFKEDITQHLILDKDEKRGLIQTFWAPEFHVINNSLYILFAVSNENWGPQCHLMKLKEGGDILKAEDWEDPVKLTRADGSRLGANGITLDMTYVKSGDRHYYVWSYREHIGTPLDTGSMLMIAEFSPARPHRLISEPVCLSRPLYGFENVSGTINNEGPYAFTHDGIIYLAYSGGDARGYLYTVGMFTARDGADLCDLNVWEKAKTPALSFASVPGELGPGHNSFFCDRGGDWWIAFHAVRFYEEKIISSGIRRIHFDSNNKPRFDLAREEDLPEKYRLV